MLRLMINTRVPGLELPIDPNLNHEHLIKLVAGVTCPDPSLEPRIAQDAATAVWYAVRILKGRFELGEPAIATDSFFAKKYAIEATNARFLAGEEIISKSIYADEYYRHFKDSFDQNDNSKYNTLLNQPTDEILQFVRLSNKRYLIGEMLLRDRAKKGLINLGKLLEYYNITKYREPHLEYLIASSAEHSYRYAILLGKRFLKGEDVIAKNADIAYQYAKNIIKGRFDKAEPAIAKDARLAYTYATEILKGRFYQAESTIAKDANMAYFYAAGILKGRFHEAEKLIARNATLAFTYAENVIHGRFDVGEKAIFRDQKFTMQYRQLVKKTSSFRLASLCPKCFQVVVSTMEKKICKCDHCGQEFDVKDPLANTRKVKINAKDYEYSC